MTSLNRDNLATMFPMFAVSCTVLLFSKSNKMLLGYFDPGNVFLQIIKINNFGSDLPDISAEKYALVLQAELFCGPIH